MYQEEESILKNILAKDYSVTAYYKLCMNAVKENGLELQFVDKKALPEHTHIDIDKTAVKQNGWALQWVTEQTPELCRIAVCSHTGALKWIKDTSTEGLYPEICIVAVLVDGYCLDKVLYQTFVICLAAVKSNGCALQYVKVENFTKEEYQQLCHAALRNDPYALEYVDHKLLDAAVYLGMCVEAVRRKPRAVAYAKVQTYEMCTMAIESDIYSYLGIRDPTEAMGVYVVSEEGSMLKYIKNKTEAICLAAVRQNGRSLKYVLDKTTDFYHKICIEAVLQNVEALRYAGEEGKPQDEEVCMTAVKKNGRAIKYAICPSDNVCRAALDNTKSARKFILDKEQLKRVEEDRRR